jgi:glycosyltransferase involved in cell wall biosynthesis
MKEADYAGVLVLVPAHNERASLPTVVADVREHCPGISLLVVDDCSSDQVTEMLEGLSVPWVRLLENVGVGTAVRTGLRWAHLQGFETVVRLDGDGQHLASQIQLLLGPLLARQADAVVGSRYVGATSFRTPLNRRLGQLLVATCLTLLTGQRVSDPTSGFWAFGPRAVAFLAAHHPTGYPEPELRLLLKRNRLSLQEVPVQMRQRVAGRSTLTLGRSLLALGRVLLAMVVSPLRVVEESPLD